MPGPGFFWFGEEERNEVLDVMESGWLFRYGDEKDLRFKHKVYSLEKQVMEKFKVPYALAVSSGTSALITSLAALGIGPGDEVIVPGYTFIASISSIIMRGAIPVLAEIDESLTLDPDDVEKKISKRTKAIMVVHMLGNPADLTSLLDISQRHGLFIIEDTAQAFGGTYKGQFLGTIGDIGTYSFNFFKTISAGDGGLLVTKDRDFYTRSFAYHDQGHLPLRTGTEIGQRSIIGQNFRMNELTGAVALAQFRKIDSVIGRLHEIKDKLKSEIDSLVELNYRRINDEEGECATILTILFSTTAEAEAVAQRLGTKTIKNSGWHVYSNMEQILKKKTVTDREFPFYNHEDTDSIRYEAGMLPKTDDILARAVNISIGVLDAGLGAGFGANPHSSNEELVSLAAQLSTIVTEIRKK